MKTLDRTARAALVLASLALTMTTLAGEATAQKASGALPTGTQILDRFVEAIGGAERLEAQKSRIMRGAFSIPAQGLSGKLTNYHQAPNKMRNIIEIPMLGKMEQGYDGEVAWSADPLQGPRILEGKEREMFLVEADMMQHANYAELFSRLETTGSERFNDADCWVVEMTTKGGVAMTGYFDRASHLMVGVAATAPSPMGDIATVTQIGGYKDFGGVKHSTDHTTTMMGMETKLTFDEIVVNPPELPSFSPPASVQELLKDR